MLSIKQKQSEYLTSEMLKRIKIDLHLRIHIATYQNLAHHPSALNLFEFHTHKSIFSGILHYLKKA